MPPRELPMKKIRDLIRLKYETRLSHEQIARALSISKGVVAKYVGRVEARGLDPAELVTLDEDELARRLASAPRRPQYGGRVMPDYGEVHRELKRPGVTLTLLWDEYRRAHEGAATYGYSQFAERYREYVSTLRRSMRQDRDRLPCWCVARDGRVMLFWAVTRLTRASALA